MRLHTKVEIPTPNFTIGYNNTICLFGSCFASNFGNLLTRLKFPSLVNPFGVLYNPASIHQGIKILRRKNNFLPEDLHFYNEKWFSFYHHSDFSNPDKEICLNNINNQLAEAKHLLNKTDVIFITLGTSWIYRNNSSKQIVANCHKIPACEFTREFLEPEATYDLLVDTVKDLTLFNPKINIVLTISPIRHFKDGAIENMRSKSSLIIAVNKLQKNFSNCYYFPVYEIFMDELRDYRFYKTDMLHPAEIAINYVWQIFSSTFFSTKTIELIDQVEKLIKSYEHNPSNKQSENYKKFISKLLNKTQALEKLIPEIDFSIEKERLIDFI